MIGVGEREQSFRSYREWVFQLNKTNKINNTNVENGLSSFV